MSYADFQRALKMGKKEMQNCLAKGENPYVSVLEDALGDTTVDSEVSLGVMQVPLSEIVGTYTRGRSMSFARNFMPLLESNTEFGTKWIMLCESHVESGIRDSIKCYEYMNRYYVAEGNKRVSVLKYFGAVSINAEVTRIVPVYQEDDPQIRLYYEYMDFYRICGLNYIRFTREGSYERLLKACRLTHAEDWTEEVKRDFFSNYTRFGKAYEKVCSTEYEHITVSDALLKYLQVFHYPDMEKKTEDQLIQEVRKLVPELSLMNSEEESVTLFDPHEENTGLLGRIRRPASLKVGFIFERENPFAVTSHEAARKHLEEHFGDQVRTAVLMDVFGQERHPEEIIEDWIRQEKPDVLFTSPLMQWSAASIAVRHPEIKVLNCNMSNTNARMRSYFGRMYEAEFLMGVIAGALTKTGRIGYTADFPNAGMFSCINAFALGIRMTCPEAKVYVAWTSVDADPEQLFIQNGVDIAEYQYGIHEEWEPGLYSVSVDTCYARSYWDWNLFYEKIVGSILKGSWKNTDEPQSVSYWWGLASGVIQIQYENTLPEPLTRMVKYLQDGVAEWELDPFGGEIRDQAGQRRCAEGESLSTYDRTHMDWMAKNVVGEVPDTGSPWGQH